jgi:hypothetical protein
MSNFFRLRTKLVQFWPTWIMALFYLTQIVRWPPHYEDEPWIWTPAINSTLGLGTRFPSFGYSVDANPVANWLFSRLLEVSPFEFWKTARGLSLASLVLICLITVSLNKRFFKTQTSIIFQTIFMTLPLADGLLYARLEVYSLAVASLGIIMRTANSPKVKFASFSIFALAVSIHPLALVLVPFVLINPSVQDHNSNFLRNFQIRKMGAYLSIFIGSLVLLNLSNLLQWSEYAKTLKRTGSSSTIFSDFSLIRTLVSPTGIIRNSVSQFKITNQNFELIVAICFLGLLAIGVWYAGHKNKRWLVCLSIAVLLHVILVSRDEVYYIAIFAPLIATLFSIRFDTKRLLKRVSFLALLICAAKMTVVTQFPSLLSKVTPTQFALDAQSPYDYTKHLLEEIPVNSVIVGTPILRAVFENRADVKVYGMTALTVANVDSGQQIHNCKQVLNQLEKIFARHPNDNKFLILYGNWQSRAFIQYSDTFNEEDFLCVIKDVTKTRTLTGSSSNGISWNWVIRLYGNWK